MHIACVTRITSLDTIWTFVQCNCTEINVFRIPRGTFHLVLKKSELDFFSWHFTLSVRICVTDTPWRTPYVRSFRFYAYRGHTENSAHLLTYHTLESSFMGVHYFLGCDIVITWHTANGGGKEWQWSLLASFYNLCSFRPNVLCVANSWTTNFSLY